MKSVSIFKCLLFFSLLFVLACKKEFSIENSFPIKNPAGQNIPTIDEPMVRANIMLLVLDSTKKPISSATVSCGTYTVMTDKSGYAMFEDLDISAHNGAVSVKKDGYFSCTRTFVTTAGRWNYLRVMLNEKKLSGSIQSEKGGLIKLPSGASLTLPPNGMVLKGTTTLYNGIVHVYAHWLDPASPNLMNEMQGELRGINISGEEKALKTYGMLNVELEGENGVGLQLDSAQLSSITFPVSSEMMSSAQSIIPLWHFSDSTHRWVEEGMATRKGNVYVGNVSHFSSWNLDYPHPYKLVNCKFRILTSQHRPFFNNEIVIHQKGDNWGGHGLPDQDGYIDCLVPEGTELLLDILGCNIEQFKIGPYTEENNVDSIVLNINDGFTIKGNVVDCNGVTVNNGYVEINDEIPQRILLSNGYYEYSKTSICGSSNTSDSIRLYSMDLDSKIISFLHAVPRNLGKDTLLDIQDCNTLVGATISNGLLAYYPFDANALDQTGNGFDGITNNVSLIPDRFGVANSAYDFDGLSSSIQVAHDVRLNALPISISCWSKFNRSNNQTSLVNKYLDTSSGGWNLALHPELGILPCYVQNSQNGIFSGSKPRYYDTSSIWRHIVFVVDETSGGKLYLNGILKDTYSWIGSPGQTTNTFPMYFGFFPPIGFYKGALDDIRIYNRVLTQDEILYLATH